MNIKECLQKYRTSGDIPTSACVECNIKYHCEWGRYNLFGFKRYK